MRIESFLLLTFISAVSAGAAFEGTVSVTSNDPACRELLLRKQNGVAVRVFSNDPEVSDDLGMLEDGDYLSASGDQLMPDLAQINHIEFIGIARLLGSWTDDHAKRVISFENFHLMNRVDLPSPKIERLAYSLVPEDKDRWTIFISNNRGVQLGALSYSPRGSSELLLILFDAKTGSVRERLHLYPIYFNILGL